MVAAKRLGVGLVLGEKVQFQLDITLRGQMDIYGLYRKNFYFSSLYLISTVTLVNFHGDCVKQPLYDSGLVPQFSVCKHLNQPQVREGQNKAWDLWTFDLIVSIKFL